MQKSIILTVTLTIGLAVEWCLARIETTRVQAQGGQIGQFTAADTIGRAPTLDQLCSGALKIVDLTWPLNDKGAYWPGNDYKPFELRTIATLEKNGVSSKAFCMPEHQGTHIDAPNHFEANRPSVDRIAIEDLFAAGVLIDVSLQAAADADYALTQADVEAWEQRNGRIPERAVVLLKTGWGRHFQNPVRYRNQDAAGRMHFPGFSAEAVQFLIERRNIRGIGLDTLSLDPGQSRDFAVHHLLGRAGRYGLENLADLDELPATNFYLVVAPIKIETGTGGPTRVLAILR
ncbi:MAG TPA: cyclase family protein [Pirellulales bacterium]|jgi:kynurenine formamidase|nr:cyclase family protein [Pirellulales bacterium]